MCYLMYLADVWKKKVSDYSLHFESNREKTNTYTPVIEYFKKEWKEMPNHENYN